LQICETTGKTVEEALRLAAEELGVDVSEVGYEVIDQSGKSFLGLGAKCHIRAWVKGEDEDAGESAEEADLGSETDAELAKSVMDIVTTVVEAMKLDVKAEFRGVTDEEIKVELLGSEVAILIGKRGQTLDALQYLVAMAVGKNDQTRKRVILDAEGYRERHARMVERKAMEFADAVRQHGREAVLDPQPARDRRIVHMLLADDPDVCTYSEGDGEDRHVVISPRT